MKTILIKDYTIAVDDKNVSLLEGHKWYVINGRYVCSRFGGKTQYLHRLIMQPPSGMEVDHIDGNGLNNIESNLRICSKKQNNRNRASSRNSSSKYKGVYWIKNIQKWRAALNMDGRTTLLGNYLLEIDAAKAYDSQAKKVFGEYAKLNLEGM